ncbi:hypothetical protein [Bradyrhizobium sp. CB3481]|uniref:hypothetical protein n=1 Tax=Bradyrhizobium sp. CB3481 TaxID=3039158 RepID=UPI0024B1578C|nr:hypothetical protein [Bradyrhizobium sp. CB3481]WFU13465.1 hypothetical protein QA643_19575 [Bradyrhizobium sp. CB3481]
MGMPAAPESTAARESNGVTHQSLSRVLKHGMSIAELSLCRMILLRATNDADGAAHSSLPDRNEKT